jgi:hypothetical protein
MESVQRTGRRVVLQLAYGIGGPAPHRGAVVIVLSGKLIGARGALVKRLFAIPLEHQTGRAPGVDLGYYAAKIIERS